MSWTRCSGSVCGHIIIAFEPKISGVLPGTRTANSLVGTVFFILINGQAAVVFFFVLSGYVLTTRFFENPVSDYLMTAALKRLPRLALLTTIVTVASALIWLSDLYLCRQASELTGSSWLHDFASANLPDNFHPSLLGAFGQGMWRTFFAGDSYYDTVLWTMMYEFHGSIVVFIAAPFIVFVLKNKLAWLSFTFALLIFRFASPYMMSFICGMGIAYYRQALFSLASPPLTAILVFLGVYLLGFYLPDGHYAVFANFLKLAAGNGFVFQILLQTIGATCIIIAVLQSPIAERILDNRIGVILGRLSFPIYLVHVPIILSASSAVYLGLFPFIGERSIWGAAASTLILTFAISWPLAWIDITWVQFLNGQMRKLLLHLDKAAYQ